MDLVSNFPVKWYFKNVLIFTSQDLSARTSEYLHKTKKIQNKKTTANKKTNYNHKKKPQNGLSCICEQDYSSSVLVSVTQLSIGVLLSQKTAFERRVILNPITFKI